jgi:hypothetical protein
MIGKGWRSGKHGVSVFWSVERWIWRQNWWK